MKKPAPWIFWTLLFPCTACAIDFGINKRDGWPEEHETVEAVDGADADTGDAADVPREEMIIPPSCGDGTVDAGEQCDDGNDSNSDACLNNCENARCGDGYVREGEEACDGGGPFPCTTSCGVDGQGPCSGDCTLPGEADCSPASDRCCDAGDCDDDNSCTTEECVDTYCIVTPIADLTACTGGICCDGLCRPGGECCVDADCDGCSGTPTPCSDIDPEVCNSQSGCFLSAMPQCYGTGDPCSSFTTMSMCSDCRCTWAVWCTGTEADCSSITSQLDCPDCGCTWGIPSCTGGSIGCSVIRTQSECINCGCYWDSHARECEGDFPCSDLADSTLCSACGCSWTPPGCYGNHRACSNADDQASCEAELGCTWSTCTGYVCG